MKRTTQAMLFTGGLLAAAAVWGLVARSPSNAQRRSGDGTQGIPPEYQVLEYPSKSAYADLSLAESRQTLGKAVATSFRQWDFDDAEVRNIQDGIIATTSLLSTGDVDQYLAYRDAFSCVIKPSAVALADQQYATGRVPDIDATVWDGMSAEEKFRAVASNPDNRAAAILSAATGSVRTGLGQRGSIPVGYRTQGLMSGFAPPSPDLFLAGADTEWAWAEIPIQIDATKQAILRYEFVRDPAVNAWLLQRAAILAPESVKLPWIVF